MKKPRLYLLQERVRHEKVRKKYLETINRKEERENHHFHLGIDMEEKRHSKLEGMPRMMGDFVVLVKRHSQVKRKSETLMILNKH